MARLDNLLEENFCREYARHGRGERAVLAAGYRAKSCKEGSSSASAMANQLLKSHKIKARIDELVEQRHRKADVDIEYVLIKLKTVVQRSLQEVRPIIDAQGRPTGEYQYDGKGATAALRLIGDYLGMFSEKLATHLPAGDTYNTQVNVYIPDNQRQAKELVYASGNGSGSSESQGSATGQTGRTAGTLSLPGNGTH